MDKQNPPKPKSQNYQPEITRLPDLTAQRKIFRKIIKFISLCLVRLFTRVTVIGIQNFPKDNSALVVANHLGDADAILGIALTPRPVELIATSKLFNFPILGWILDQYGVIWIHRGQPDRRALRAALQALQQQRLVCIAPEGRESLTGSLEEGTRGAAFLAYKSQAPIIPITYTQTENWRIISNIKHFKKTQITITIGKAFYLEPKSDRQNNLEAGTHEIMQRLAKQLPEEYRGAYL